MNRSAVIAIAASIGVGALLVVTGTFVRFDVRHSSPYGFSKTIDFARLIAVSGGYVTPNYNDFNRLDLDLRAYSPGETYDLAVHIRPAQPGAGDVRTVRLDLPASRIYHRKRPFADPFVTVRFPPIADSAGKTFYVWIETGPRNRDDIVALWSMKSYSRIPAWQVVSAFLDEAPGGRNSQVVRLALILLLAGLVLAACWLVWGLAATSLSPQSGIRRGLVRWHRHESDGIQ